MRELRRVYDPAECDERGVPLDWECCRACEGRGYAIDMRVPRVGPRTALPEGCPVCGGYGSLKAAALSLTAFPPDARRTGLTTISQNLAMMQLAGLAPPTMRCEGCGHPMSEGTWESGQGGYRAAPWAAGPGAGLLAAVVSLLREGEEPDSYHVHYSPCDEGCTHSGPGRHRWLDEDYLTWQAADALLERSVRPYEREASWRPVDVHTLGWPHDLRPEKLAVLCLRCWAARSR